MNKFMFSLWNYIDADKYKFSVNKIVKEWYDLKINVGCSFVCDGSSKQLSKNIELINKAKEKKIQMFVYDKRIFFSNYKNNGKEKYLKDVRQTLQDYQNCPNIIGFILADEPNKENLKYVMEAYEIFKNETSLIGFVNFSWCDYRNVEYGSRENYQRELVNVCQNNLQLISNDRYSCLHSKNYEEGFKETGIDKYFKDLNFFYEVAKQINVPYITSLLSVGHWMYRTPSDKDIRWQLSTSFSHGVQGIMWFFIHQHRLADDYYDYPIDIHGNKTRLYDDLKNQTIRFVDHVVKPLEGYTFKKVWHIEKNYGDTKLLEKNDTLVYCHSDHHQNGILSYFEKGKEKAYLLVNNDQEYAEVFFIEFKDNPDKNYHIWLDAGGTHIIFIK